MVHIWYNRKNFYYINSNYKLFWTCFKTLKNTLDVALVIHLMINYRFIKDTCNVCSKKVIISYFKIIF